MYCQSVSTSRLLRVAFAPSVAFAWPTPIPLLQLAFTTFFYFLLENNSNTITLLLLHCLHVFPHNLTTSGVFLRRSSPQGYP